MHGNALLLLSLSTLVVSGYSVITRQVNTVTAIPDWAMPVLPKEDSRSEADAVPSVLVGGRHGSPFSDKQAVDAERGHKRISYITLAGCGKNEHVSLIELGFRDNHELKTPKTSEVVTHGKYYGTAPETTLEVKVDGYISSFLVTTWKKKVTFGRHTRIGWIKVTDNNGKVIECGGRLSSDSVTEPVAKDHVSLYLSGAAGNALDNLQGYSIKKEHYF